MTTTIDMVQDTATTTTSAREKPIMEMSNRPSAAKREKEVRIMGQMTIETLISPPQTVARFLYYSEISIGLGKKIAPFNDRK